MVAHLFLALVCNPALQRLNIVFQADIKDFNISPGPKFLLDLPQLDLDRPRLVTDFSLLQMR